MPKLLHIDSSPMGEHSISRRLTCAFVERWRRANPRGEVVYRDLTAMSIPPINAAWVSANLTPKESRTPQQNDVLTLSRQLTAELLTADEYVIGIPMHNWGPSSSFKLWLDQLVHFGETLIITPSGVKGALGDKRVTFLIAAGQRYSAGSPNASRNYLEPWLRTMFGYFGVTNMQFILADGAVDVLHGNLDCDTFLAPHLNSIESLFAGPVST